MMVIVFRHSQKLGSSCPPMSTAPTWHSLRDSFLLTDFFTDASVKRQIHQLLKQIVNYFSLANVVVVGFVL